MRFQARDFSPNKWPLFSSVLLMMLFWRWGLAQGAGASRSEVGRGARRLGRGGSQSLSPQMQDICTAAGHLFNPQRTGLQRGVRPASSLDTWSQSPRVLSPQPVILCEITWRRTPLVTGPRPNSGKESWALCLCSGHTAHYG